MAAVDPPNLPKALLQWVQTFPTKPATARLSDLRDGHIIQQILHDIDPAYFDAQGLPAGASDTANNWVQRWQNLKHIQRGVDGYIRDVCGVVGGDVTRHANLKAVAQAEGDAAVPELVQLLKGILRAAMYSPESNERMGRVVVGLGAEVAGTIAAAMAGMEEERYQEEGENGALERSGDEAAMQQDDSKHKEQGTDEHTTPPGRTARQDRDLELEHEEKLISTHRIIRQLEESNAKAALEFEDLRVEKKRVEDAFEALQQDSRHGEGRRAEDCHVRELRDQSDKDREYIAELESELETARSTTETQGRQLERLKGSADTVQQLKDDLQLLRAERDELASKTRTNENLRKKIQNLQDAERRGTQLADELRAAQEQLGQLDTLRERCDALAKANAEKMNIIASSEQEIFDMRSGRKRLEHELRVLGQKYDIARERQTRDHEAIAELEARLAEDSAAGQLGEELDRAAAERPALPSRKASLVGGGGAAADAMLEERLAALARRNKALEETYLELLSDKLGLETALAEVRDGSGTAADSEHTAPFLEQRAKLASVSAELDAQKAETNRLAARLAEKLDTADAAAERKGLAAAYAALAAEADALRAEVDEQRALLRFALLSARGIGAEDNEERWTSERKVVEGLLEEAREATAVGDVADAVVARVEVARREGAKAAGDKDAALEALRKELDDARAEVARLQEEKKTTTEGVVAAAPVDEETTKTLAQLKRENMLMSTAWFDLSARIQRENVILGRRRESPKSWLGKQRGLVGLGVSGVGR